ncbi:MAG: hypothetical protein Q8N17_18780 [Burkholderiaceae bacterium]|nr:hypothetical protein [Burkholderiaceae bacterium]
MQEALRGYLAEPSPHPTLFYVLDKLERLATSLGRLPATSDIVGAQAKGDAPTAARVEAILVTAWNHGLIRVYPHDAIELTAGGAWLIKEGRSRRLALWAINPHLSLESVCAIVHVEDGEGPIAEVPLGLLDGMPRRMDDVCEEANAVTTRPSGNVVARTRGMPEQLGPVWRGLLATARL